MSVTAIDGDVLQARGLTDLGDVVRYAPNVHFYDSSSLFASLNIRGVGTPPIGIGVEPTVGLQIDDVPYGRSMYAEDGLFDLERLEVLRGPQGVLFGKNTVAGLLNISTVEPSFDLNGHATLSLGSLADKRAEGAVSFPVVDDVLAARLSFRAHGREIGMRNTTRGEEGDSEDVAARLKLLWRPAHDFELKLTAWGSDETSRGYPLQLERATSRSLEIFREFDPRTETDAFDGRTAIDGEQSTGRRAYAVSAKGVWSLGRVGAVDDLELTAIGAWSQLENPVVADSDISPIPFARVYSVGSNPYEQLSLELRGAGSLPPPFGWGEGLDFLAGVFADKTDSILRGHLEGDLNAGIAYVAAGAASEPSDIGGAVSIPPETFALLDDLIGPLSLPDLLRGPAASLAGLQLIPPALDTERSLLETSHETVSIAGFFQTIWHASKRWDVTLGGRLTFDAHEAHIISRRLVGLGVTSALIRQRFFDRHLEFEETDFSPKLALSHFWSDEVTFFAAATRGFKPGGVDKLALNDDHLRYEAERAVSLEAGVKSRLLGGAMTLNATGFWSRFEDLQVKSFTGITLTSTNADRATSRGFELDWQWLPPLDGLTIVGGLGLAVAEFDRYRDATPTLASREDTQDLSGRTLPYAPELSASLYPSYAFPLIPSWGVGALVGADFLYRSGAFLDTDLDPQTYQDATARLNLRFALFDAEGRWRLVLNAKNVSGVRERLLVFDQPLLDGNYVAFPLHDEPTFTIDLGWSFG